MKIGAGIDSEIDCRGIGWDCFYFTYLWWPVYLAPLMWPIPLQPGIGHPVGPGTKSAGANIIENKTIITGSYCTNYKPIVFSLMKTCMLYIVSMKSCT